MKWILLGAAVVLCLCLILPAVFSMQCYVCDSVQNPDSCTDTYVSDVYKQNCSDVPGGAAYSMCRKIRQWVDYKYEGLDAIDRTFRRCGNVTTDRDYYYRAGFGGRVGVYTCYSDFCNSAPSVKIGYLPVVVLAAVAAIRHLV